MIIVVHAGSTPAASTMTEIYHQLVNEVSKKEATLICGTGPSLECLEDRALVKALCNRFNIFCVNSSHYYFDDIDVQFIGGGYLLQVTQDKFRNKTVKFLIGDSNKANLRFPFIQTRTVLSLDKYEPAISSDITVPLPHGPTTILDIAIPTCMFCGVKQIYLLGAEYSRTNFRRFTIDSQRPMGGFPHEMELAHRKWETWKEYFKIVGVSVVDLSGGELNLPKLDIRELVWPSK